MLVLHAKSAAIFLGRERLFLANSYKQKEGRKEYSSGNFLVRNNNTLGGGEGDKGKKGRGGSDDCPTGLLKL